MGKTTRKRKGMAMARTAAMWMGLASGCSMAIVSIAASVAGPSRVLVGDLPWVIAALRS